MDLFLKLTVTAICCFLVYRIRGVLRSNPELLSRENLSKSFATVGMLALILIGFVYIMIMSLR